MGGREEGERRVGVEGGRGRWRRKSNGTGVIIINGRKKQQRKFR